MIIDVTKIGWKFKLKSSVTSSEYTANGIGEGTFDIMNDDSIQGKGKEDYTASVIGRADITTNYQYDVKGNYDKVTGNVTLIIYSNSAFQAQVNIFDLPLNFKMSGTESGENFSENAQFTFDLEFLRGFGNLISGRRGTRGSATIVTPQGNYTGGISDNVNLANGPPLSFTLTLEIGSSASIHRPLGENSNYDVTLTLVCTCEEMKKVEEIKKKVEEIIRLFEQFNCVHATYALNHWLEGSGEDVPLDTKWLRQVSFIQEGEAKNEMRLLTYPISTPTPPNIGSSLVNTVSLVINDGITRNFVDHWDYARDYSGMTIVSTANVGIGNSADIDFVNTLGSFDLKSTGNFQISRISDPRIGDKIMIQGTVTHSIHDLYDFNPGDKFPPIDIKIVPQVSADELNLLKKCDKAKDYWNNATWVRTFNLVDTPQRIIEQFVNWGDLLSQFNDL